MLLIQLLQSAFAFAQGAVADGTAAQDIIASKRQHDPPGVNGLHGLVAQHLVEEGHARKQGHVVPESVRDLLK